MKDTIIAIVTIALLGLLCFVAGRRTAKEGAGETIIERVDTLVIRDTIKSVEPIYVTRRVVDSVLVPVTDTIRRTDTLYVVMEREQVRWEDSLAVVYASGIRPQVDSVIHYQVEKIVTHLIPIKEKARWGVGIQGGVGYGREGFSPYVGVGISYNILTW